MTSRFPLLAALAALAHSAGAEEVLDGNALEAGRYVVGEIALHKADVFDLNNPDENNWLYRAANRYHIVTRDKVIRKQLLISPGDLYNQRLVEESARILRQNGYLYEAQIEATRAADGTVDLAVHTRDVWSLAPELSISRSGGETRSRIGLEETNLLGRGQMLRVLHDKDIDRDENIIEFADRRVGTNWWSIFARYSDNSDGDTRLLTMTRPFYALDARWAAGGSFYSNERRTSLYQFGEQAAVYRHQRDYAYLFGGWSKGLVKSRARRWTAGVVYDDNRYSDVPTSSLPSLVPADRRLVYPFLALELIEDGYVTTRNRDQIDRTEDFQMGLSARASLGWAAESFGSDRDAAIFSASASHGFGSLDKNALFLSAWTSGRVESGDLANASLSVSARYYRRQSKKRTFYAAISGTAGESLDLDNPVELGGNTGMRGYPLRYQVGESKVLATIEQRYYTDWYPFRLARVGGAIFADVGRVYGPNPLGPDNRDWLVDVGFGLRLAMTRFASGRVAHIDLAFPLNDDATIDDVQFIIELRNSF
jgi:outer membrane protein assembly factor BamA